MTIEEIGKFNMKLLELRVINDMNNKLNKRRLELLDDEERKEFERTHNIILAPGDYNVCEYYDILAAEYIKTAIEEGNASAQKLIYKLIS